MKETIEELVVAVAYGFGLVCFYTGLFVVLRALWCWF